MHRALSILALIFWLLPLQAAGTGIPFSHLSVDDGLSNNFVGTICQDDKGNVWLGTHDGVNYYNGYDIIAFQCDPADPGSLPSNIINYLYNDGQGRIWVCTANGLAWYDCAQGTFHRIALKGVHSVERIARISDNLYLFSTRNDAYYYHFLTGETQVCRIDGTNLRFYSIDALDGSILIGTMERTIELLRFDDGGLKRKRNPIPMPHNIGHILFEGPDHCWVGMTHGLMYVDLRSGEETRATWIIPGDEELTALQYDQRGRLWIGGNDRLTVFDFSTESGQVLRADRSNAKSLSHNSVKSLFCDKDGGMWVGTEFGGVNYWNGRDERFTTLQLEGKYGSADDKVVTTLHLDQDGTLWIGSRSSGLIHYDPQTSRTTYYDIDNIRSIYCTEDGRSVYVGTLVTGGRILDKKSGVIRHFKRPSDINAIVPAGDGKLWLGSLSGLYLYDMKSDAWQKAELAAGSGITRILTLFRDSDDHLWIGAKERLREYKVAPDYTLTEIEHPELENTVQVQCLFESADSTLWIGTADGLYHYEHHAQGLRPIPEAESLSRTSVKGMEQDGEGRLWFSTDGGLVRYSPSTGEIRTYFYEDGLQSNQFNAFSAHCKDAEGRMYFGGVGGISTFHPDHVGDDARTVAPEITGLRLFNQPVLPGDKSGILSEDISVTRSITLRHNQNAIALSFACPDFAAEGRNRFQYKLEGFDADWILARSREASYIFHHKGNYRFLLKAANKDGIWSAETVELLIKVKPVWYKTAFVRILLLLLILGGLIVAEYRLYLLITSRGEKRLEETSRDYEERIRRVRMLSYAVSPLTLTKSSEDFLCSVVDAIEQNLTNPQFSVETLSDGMEMTRMTLYRKIKTLTGLTPVELVRKIRIEKACELIRESSYSIAEVGQMTGFNSPSYFNTTFKKEVGCTPGEYASLHN